jgi:hypothetical protein
MVSEQMNKENWGIMPSYFKYLLLRRQSIVAHHHLVLPINLARHHVPTPPQIPPH